MIEWLKILGFGLLAIVFVLRVFFTGETDVDDDGRQNICHGAERFCD
jgi:hypothetical protein